jgi:hypothetical protein
MTITVQQIQAWLAEAEDAARIAVQEAYAANGNTDWDACGFVWVDIYRFNDKKLDGRTKMAKLMKQAGIGQSYTRAFQVWNPGGYAGQSITIKEAAARAYARVLEQKGFTAYAGSRLD